MSYIINNSRGEVLAVVADGTVNTSATSLTLVGRSVTEYGTAENENYVFLLENFANGTAPVNPILGQLWYDSDNDVLHSYGSANVWIPMATEDYVQAQKISPIFTGVPQAPTAPTGTANTQIATTAFVTNSPAFAGVPTAPTAVTATATTQLATTAFVTNSPQFLGVPQAPTAPTGTANTQIATTQFVTNSPAFAGVPTSPTAAYNDSSTQIATTAFVQGEKVSPAFTGSPTAPTAAYGNNSTLLATTAFVQGEKISPAFGGVPTAPTAPPYTANLQIATTAYVINSLNDSGGVLGSMSKQNANSVDIWGGSITGITDLAVADGGTGASDAPTARTNLGLGTISTQNNNAISITGGTITGITDLAIADGGTGASTAADARTNLGLGTMATQNSSAVTITGGTITGTTVSSLFADLAIADGGTGASTAYNARVNLGIQSIIDALGTMANQNANAVAITGGSITGITDLAIADGGTGASDAPTARFNLGITALFDDLKTMAYQNANAVAITGGTITGGTITGGTITGITDLAIADGGTGASTAYDARVNLGIQSVFDNLGTISAQNYNAVAITGGTITGITDLAIADGGTGASDAPTARFNLGITALFDNLKTMAYQNANAVAITGGTITGSTITGSTITGGSITGITDLAIADGGTGASTAYNARVNLGIQSVIDALGTMSNQNATAVAITGGTITGITDLAVADGGTGASNAATARFNLGITALFDDLKTMAYQNANAVAITGGSITGITDLAVADGGTGASTAAGARTNLGAAAEAITITGVNGLTGGGSLAANRTITIASDSNGYGTRYVSTSSPTGGNDGDIWYVI